MIQRYPASESRCPFRASLLLAGALLVSCATEPTQPPEPTQSLPDLDAEKGATRGRLEKELHPESSAPGVPASGSPSDLDAQKAATRARLDGEVHPETKLPPKPETPAPPPPVVKPVPPPVPVPPPPRPPVREESVAPVEEPVDPGPTPEWCLNRRHPGYPDAEYLVGIGSASVVVDPAKNPEAQAQEACRLAWAEAGTDVLAQFETRIASEVTTFIQSSLKMRNEEEESRLLQAGTSRVRAMVDGSLKGFRPAEQYFNPKKGNACVLIVNRRQDYARQVADEIVAIEKSIGDTLTQAKGFEERGDAFQALRRYREAEALVVGSRELRARALIAAPGYELPASTVDLGKILGASQALTSKIDLLLVVQHEAFGKPASAAPIEEEIVSTFRNFGFKVKPAPARLADRPVEEILRDPSIIKEVLGQRASYPVILVCKFTTSGRKIEGDLLSVRTQGWARLLDVATEELLITATTPADKDVRPAIGAEDKREELILKVVTGAAELLVGQIYLHL